MIKTVLVLGAAALVAGYVYQTGSVITEAHVREFYGDQLRAYEQQDADRLCETMADDFSMSLTEHGEGPARTSMQDRHQACADVKDAMALTQLLSERSRGLLSLDVDYDVKGVEVSPGGRDAVVRVTSRVSLGDHVVALSRAEEKLSRSFWKVKTHGGKAKVWTSDG